MTGHRLLFAPSHQLEQMHVVQGCMCHCLKQHCFGSSMARVTCHHEACMHTLISLSRCILCRAAFSTVSCSVAQAQA